MASFKQVERERLDGRGQVVRLAMLCVVLALVVVTAANGQGNTTGYIVGQVASGTGPVAGAVVTARNVDTGLTRTAVSGKSGRYRVSALAVGRYAVTAAASGATGQTVLADVKVGLGAVVNVSSDSVGAIEEVVVTGQVLAPVDVTQSETTTVITSADIARRDMVPTQRDVSTLG